MAVDSRLDRTAIERLLTPHFPAMAGKSSDEWHGFLNAETGLNVSLDEPNPSAFDAWRKALSEKGFPVWGVSKARLDAIAEKLAAMQAAEAKRAVQEADALARLRQEAPDVSAKDLLK
jgi:hypothetical protein